MRALALPRVSLDGASRVLYVLQPREEVRVELLLRWQPNRAVRRPERGCRTLAESASGQLHEPAKLVVRRFPRLALTRAAARQCALGWRVCARQPGGQRQTTRRAEETDQVESGTTEEVRERQEKLSDDVDAILDEIDEVLEENAEEFVRSYVQKGGQ